MTEKKLSPMMLGALAVGAAVGAIGYYLGWKTLNRKNRERMEARTKEISELVVTAKHTEHPEQAAVISMKLLAKATELLDEILTESKKIAKKTDETAIMLLKQNLEIDATKGSVESTHTSLADVVAELKAMNAKLGNSAPTKKSRRKVRR